MFSQLQSQTKCILVHTLLPPQSEAAVTMAASPTASTPSTPAEVPAVTLAVAPAADGGGFSSFRRPSKERRSGALDLLPKEELEEAKTKRTEAPAKAS